MTITKKISRNVLYIVLALFLVASMVNCGGGSSSGPAKVQAPKSLIQNYIAKHETMVDSSLVDFYVTDEQPTIAAKVQQAIDAKKAAGELEKLQQATFDFANLQIQVVGEKEEYVNDQPTRIIKVSVTGSYIMNHADTSKTVNANETIILELVNNSWKVTEKFNPWS